MIKLMSLVLALIVLCPTASEASELPYEMVLVTWTGAKHVPFSVQTIPHPSFDSCEDSRFRIEHNLEIKNEELENVGKPRMGYTIMCREVPHG
jgi:hypothetical protein